MEIDFRSSFTHSGDNTSVQSTPGSKSKTAKNPFFTQIIVVYMIIITPLVQISLRSQDIELWLILLRRSIRYILPSPDLKFSKQSSLASSSDDLDSTKVQP